MSSGTCNTLDIYWTTSQQFWEYINILHLSVSVFVTQWTTIRLMSSESARMLDNSNASIYYYYSVTVATSITIIIIIIRFPIVCFDPTWNQRAFCSIQFFLAAIDSIQPSYDTLRSYTFFTLHKVLPDVQYNTWFLRPVQFSAFAEFPRNFLPGSCRPGGGDKSPHPIHPGTVRSPYVKLTTTSINTNLW